MDEKEKCNQFLDKYFNCVSKSDDFPECKLYLDLMDMCKNTLDHKKTK